MDGKTELFCVQFYCDEYFFTNKLWMCSTIVLAVLSSMPPHTIKHLVSQGPIHQYHGVTHVRFCTTPFPLSLQVMKFTLCQDLACGAMHIIILSILT